jgi:hypothetical protein
MNSILSEFRHELDGKQMWAQLHQNGDGYSIQCFIDNIYQGTRYINGHSLQYAEDAAENFVFGILKLNESEQV